MIRAATLADAKRITNLWNWMIRETLATFTTIEHSEEAAQDLIAERPGAFLVAEHGGKVIGFATYGPFRGGPGYAATVEHTVIVDQVAHGSGAGRALMSALESAGTKAGHHVMVGAISSANPAAIAFHQKLGFEEVGRLPEVGRKADQWLDLVLMQKILNSAF